ncbi:MAG: hypothetical protein ACOCP6_02410 [Desulfosalsimonas sp.]
MAGIKPSKQEVIEGAEKRLQELAAETGLVDSVEVSHEKDDPEGPDFVMRISGRIPPVELVVEARPSGEPRHAREAVYRLLSLTRGSGSSYPVFAAPYISEKAAEICSRNNAGFLDLAGNCRIATDGMFIRNSGNPNPVKNKRRLKSLARPGAAAVVRVLLNRPQRHWKARDLAKEAGVSLGLVSNVRQILKDRELIDTKKSRIIPARPGELLELWIREASPNEGISFLHTDDDFINAENQIAEACRKKGVKCAFTGLSAAVHLASGIDYYRQIQVRVQGKINPADTVEGFEKCKDSEANVAVIHSPHPGAFHGMRQVMASSRLRYCRPSEQTVAEIEKQIRVPVHIVSPVQAYFDLVSTLETGQKEAQKVYSQAVEPSWQAGG